MTPPIELVCPYCGSIQSPDTHDYMGSCCGEVGHCEWQEVDTVPLEES